MKSRHLLAYGLCLAALAWSLGAAAAEPYHLTKTTPVGGSPHWETLAYEAAGDRVFFSNGDEVTVLDAKTGAVTGRVHDIAFGHGLVLTSGGKGYVANGDRGTVSEFDTHTLSVSAEIPTDGGVDELAYDPVSGHLFSMNGSAHSVAVVDLAKKKTLVVVPLGGQPEMGAVDGKGHLFINMKATGEMLVFDTATNTITHRYDVKACESPHGLGYDAQVDRLFISCSGPEILVVDPNDGHIVTALHSGTESDTLQVDSKRRLVFSANGTGTLDIISIKGPDSFSIKEMKTAIGARVMTYSSRTGRLFIPTADLESTTPNAEKPDRPLYSFKPNTVRLQIYDPAATAAASKTHAKG